MCCSYFRLVALGVARGVGDFTPTEECATNLRDLILGYLVLISVSLVLECSIAFASTRGSILTHAPRSSIEYLLYGRLGKFNSVLNLGQGFSLYLGMLLAFTVICNISVCTALNQLFHFATYYKPLQKLLRNDVRESLFCTKLPFLTWRQ